MSDELIFIRLYTDEHVMPELSKVLRQYGFTALSAQEAETAGWSDDEQLAYATEHGMALLTYDIDDFTTLARNWHEAGRAHAGIILSQPFTKNEFGALLRQVLTLLNQITADDIRNRVVVLQSFR
jgi:predicted nuclease of predicted toxin-antitoxin system